MNFKKLFRNKKREKIIENNRIALDFLGGTGLDVDNIDASSDLSDSVYFVCLKHLSETLAKMKWGKVELTQDKGKERILDFSLRKILNIRPNPYQNAFTFWASVEQNRLHHGNAFIYIERERGEIKNLWILQSEAMQIIVDNECMFSDEKNKVYYMYQGQILFTNEILHFKTSTSFDGITGVAVRDYLSTQISSKKNAEGFMNKLYKSNMFGSKILVHYSGSLKTKSEQSLAKKLESFVSNSSSGRVIPLPLGTEAKLLDMKLSDSQFQELKKLSALELAAAFGIKPNVINNYDKSSYSNSETQQLDFYVNTLQPIFSEYEQELTHKLISPLDNNLEFFIDTSSLFKLDRSTQADVYSKYLNNFIMTPNEVREQLGLPNVEGGDVLVGNGNLKKINVLGGE